MTVLRKRTWPPLFSMVLFLTIFIIMTSLPGTTVAQPEQDEQAAAATGIEFQPRIGEYHYDILWGPNRVGTGVISIERDADHYVLKAKKKTTGLVGKIYRLDYRGEARIKTERLVPTDATIVEENRKRKKVQEVRYPDPGESGPVKVVETRSREKQQEVETKEYEFESDTGVVDIFSAIFLARSFDWEIGERHEFLIFSGSTQYQVTMDCLGIAMFDIDEEKIPVWFIQPTTRKLSEEIGKITHEDTVVYLSTDESRDIMKVKTKLGIGSVKLRLVKYLEQ